MKKCYHEDDTPVKPLRCNPSVFGGITADDLKRYPNVPLVRLLGHVDFEAYRPILQRDYDRYAHLVNPKSRPMPEGGLFPAEEKPADAKPARHRRLSRAGRPPLDVVLMFTVVFLGVCLRKSDEELSFMILDSTLIRLFLDLPLGFRISPQAIWRYREIFTKADTARTIALKHIEELIDCGLIDKVETKSKSDSESAAKAEGGTDPKPEAKAEHVPEAESEAESEAAAEPEGQAVAAKPAAYMLDGSYVEAPRQHNTAAENHLIKAGYGAALWNDQPAKKRQKDIEATWSQKGSKGHKVSFWGYKLHALVEAMNKFIIYGVVLTACVHDSKAVELILNEDDAGREFYADSAYDSEAIREILASIDMTPMICKKGKRNAPLTEADKEENREKSRTRSRVEHVFGFIEKSLGGSFVRTIGKARAHTNQWLTILAYNLFRQETVLRLRRQNG